jgi:alpha,alpha-trehalase
LYSLEKTLAEASLEIGDSKQASAYLQKSEKRKASILTYCWSSEKKFFFDFDFVANKQKEAYTLAAAFPLFFEIATPQQASGVEAIIKTKFLKPRWTNYHVAKQRATMGRTQWVGSLAMDSL